MKIGSKLDGFDESRLRAEEEEWRNEGVQQVTDTQSQGREGLIERLRAHAVTRSRIQRVMAEAKSSRQTDNPTGECVYPWSAPEEQDEWKAADLLAALPPLPDTEGRQMVPKEPTEAMIQAACDATFGHLGSHEEAHLEGWSAMLAVSPAPPSIDGMALKGDAQPGDQP